MKPKAGFWPDSPVWVCASRWRRNNAIGWPRISPSRLPQDLLAYCSNRRRRGSGGQTQAQADLLAGGSGSAATSGRVRTIGCPWPGGARPSRMSQLAGPAACRERAPKNRWRARRQMRPMLSRADAEEQAIAFIWPSSSSYMRRVAPWARGAPRNASTSVRGLDHAQFPPAERFVMVSRGSGLMVPVRWWLRQSAARRRCRCSAWQNTSQPSP